MKTLERHLSELLLGSIPCLLVIAGCGDVDDSPSTRDLLIGDWDLEEVNGNSNLNGILSIELEPDGDYSELLIINGVGSFTNSGEWTLIGMNAEVENDDGEDYELGVMDSISETLLVEDEFGDELLFERD